MESLLPTEQLLLVLMAVKTHDIPVTDSFIDHICIDLSLEPVARRFSSWLKAQHETYLVWPKMLNYSESILSHSLELTIELLKTTKS